MVELLRERTGIHHEAHGQGEPILLTHGFGATTRMWDEQIEALSDRHRLILWDLPGHGRTQLQATEITTDSLIADMLSTLDTEGVDRAILTGLGVGGQLSLRFWRAFPKRVRALVLIGTMPGLRSLTAREIWNRQADEIAETVERGGLDALEGGVEVDPRLHTSPRDIARAARMLLTQRDAGALPWLHEIDVPVLILVGSEDRPNLSAADYMANTIPRAHKVVIPRANHAVNIQKPDPVNTAIRDFLRRLPP